MHATSMTSTVLLVWKAIDSYGHDANELFEEAGLDPMKLHDPRARYPDPAVDRMLELAIARVNEPCFGLRMASFFHPTTLNALGYAWMASATLRDGLHRLARYFRLVTQTDEVVLVESGEGTRMVIRNTEVGYRAVDEVYDTFLTVLVEMCRTVCGHKFDPRRVTFQRGEPACVSEFYGEFRCPIEFNAGEDAIFFDKADLDVPLPTANVELARANERIIAEYIADIDQTTVSMRVKTKLIEQLPSGETTEETVARATNLSPRTLQRRLKDEGTSYKQLLEETRRELAEQYVRDSGMPIKEITFLLGFSEPANFSRAFKRWTGVSPSSFRGS